MSDHPPEAVKSFNEQVIEEYRANGGVLSGNFAGANLLLLTTTGAKSGKPRTAPVAYGTDGDRTFVVASKAGADTNPDWFHNLVANPSVTVEQGAETYTATAVVADETERPKLFARMVETMPGFADYENMTSRVIPVVLLERS